MRFKTIILLVGCVCLLGKVYSHDLAPADTTPVKSNFSFSINTAHKLTLSGYTQFRYQQFQDTSKKDGFDLRRVRLDLKGEAGKKTSYRLQVDFAGIPKIYDATISYAVCPFFKLTAGQFKIPFSKENLQSANKLETINRSQIVEALVNRSGDVNGNQSGRDIGIMASGTIAKSSEHNLVEYSFGLFNGSGINVTDNNSDKDISARMIVLPSKGLAIGASVYDGVDRWGVDKSRNKIHDRIGFDLNYVYKRISVNGEFITGNDDHIKKSGYYLQSAFFVVPEKLQFVLRYDFFDPDLKSDKNISTIYLAGGTWIISKEAKLQLNYEYHSEEGSSLQNDLITAQLQLQF